MSWAGDFASRCHEGITEEVRESLWGRGVDDEQMRSFCIGYIDQDLPPCSDHFLRWAQGGEKIRGHLVLPLTDWQGVVWGLQFRSVDPTRKGYQDYFLDKSKVSFFGMGQAAPSVWETNKVVLVEGAFDLFPVQRVTCNVIATLTAKVYPALARSLYRLVNQVALFYDDDDTGRKGVTNFLRFYGSSFDSRVMEYPFGVTTCDGHRVNDPSDLWSAWGDDRFGPYLRNQLEW